MKKLYLRPSIEIMVSESVVMDTDSHGWTSGEQALAKPNQPLFDWDEDIFSEESEEENNDLFSSLWN